jgi:hypothetical protein
VLERLGWIDEVTVSDWGLREGLLLDAHGSAPPRARWSCARPRSSGCRTPVRARRSPPGPRRPPRRAAVRRHRRAARARRRGPGLLQHAAELHTIGEALALRRQQVHGAYLVENAELRGFDPAEMAMLVTLVRFHRPGGSPADHPPSPACRTPPTRARTERLLALLQVADGLDRGHDQAVTGVDGAPSTRTRGAHCAGGGLHDHRGRAGAQDPAVARACSTSTSRSATGPLVTSPPAPDEDPAEPPPEGTAVRTPRIHQLRARYARRVTPEHVGQRVSIRHLVATRNGARSPSDVVGRLVGADAEAMLVVDRAGQLTVIDTREILSSRVVPPHPKLEPEPAVGTRAAPLERAAARALVLDVDDRVLLVAHVPDATRRVWTAPG